MDVIIRDESLTGSIINELLISIENEHTTVKDLISARVTSEVEKYNSNPAEFFKGLVQPSAAEATLNGYKLKRHKQIDVEEQVYIALDAFQKNGYFVLIDDVQAETLEQEVMVGKSTKVSFVKLTPLVGG